MIQVKVTMDIENSQFSAREKEVIDLLLQGKSNKQIAFELHIAQSTVEYHLKNIYHKLEVASRTEAVIQLGKSTGQDTPSELGEIQAEKDSRAAGNDGKPISIQRIPVNKMYWIIGGLLIVLVVTITLPYVLNKGPDGTPTSVPIPAATDIPTTVSTPQASATTPVLSTPTATGTSQPTSTQSQGQGEVDVILLYRSLEVFLKPHDPQCLPCKDLMQYLEDPGDVDNPEKMKVWLPQNAQEVFSILDELKPKDPWEQLDLLTAFAMTIYGVPQIPNSIEAGHDYSTPVAPPAGDSKENDPYYRAFLRRMQKVYQIREDSDALKSGNFISLTTSSNIISYARLHEVQTVIVVLNNSATQQQITIDLGASGITCSNVVNLLKVFDRKIQLIIPESTEASAPEASSVSLSVTLDPWESKIIECQQ